MRLRATAQLAYAALLRNRMRSLLTMLGVVIGVGAVLMMQSLGSGATAYIENAISGMGSNVLLIVPGSPRARQGMGASLGVPLFTPADMEALRRGVHDLTSLAGTSSRNLRLVAGGNNRNSPVSGISPEFFQMRTWAVAEGRALTQEDERQAATVCVLGKTVADALFPGLDPVGRQLRVHEVPCRVVGLLEAKGASAFGMDQDDIVYMPLSTFGRRITGSDRVPVMLGQSTPEGIDAAKEKIASILRQRRHILPGEDDDFAVRDPRELQALLDQVTGVLTAFLLGVAGISLLVGGIGIMNIMLVSVTERTREIGVRLAVGARARDILRQFVVEAVTLSAAGGVVGLLFGLGGAWVLSKVLGVPYVIPFSAVPVALGVSALVGVVFGVVPARKASRLSPLAALRFE
jgi:putative ABC transport system permease protein